MRDVDFAHTRTAQESREAKATRLARFMADTRLPRAPASNQERRDVERAAGVKRASDETWARAIEIWEQIRHQEVLPL